MRLHSMIDEHFGISVVECMASGVIPIAHNSAGPKMDIVLNEGGLKTGFPASNKEEYTEAILKVINMPEAERLAIAAAARKRAPRFSEQKFFEDFHGCKLLHELDSMVLCSSPMITFSIHAEHVL
ncbi:unnamed protein product [Musa textilis]